MHGDRRGRTDFFPTRERLGTMMTRGFGVAFYSFFYSGGLDISILRISNLSGGTRCRMNG
jgi:hypothetical protein